MKTGVDWCELDVTAELAGLAAEVRANELRVRGLVEACGKEALSRLIVADGVDAAGALLAFVRRDDVPLEVCAAAVHFLHGHIHPFRNGNGHAARMLACAMLSERYSPPTLLALLRRPHRPSAGTRSLSAGRLLADARITRQHGPQTMKGSRHGIQRPHGSPEG